MTRKGQGGCGICPGGGGSSSGRSSLVGEGGVGGIKDLCLLRKGNWWFSGVVVPFVLPYCVALGLLLTYHAVEIPIELPESDVIEVSDDPLSLFEEDLSPPELDPFDLSDEGADEAWGMPPPPSAPDEEEDEGPPTAKHPLFWTGLGLFAAVVIVHVSFILSTWWSVSMMARIHYSKQPSIETATHVRIVPKPHKGLDAIVPLMYENCAPRPDFLHAPPPGDGLYFFLYQERRFEFDTTLGRFVKPFSFAHLPMGEYRGLRGWDRDEDVAAATSIYGQNAFKIPVPEFGELFAEHAQAPFFVFQMFCVLLWMLDESWYYSVFTAFMLVMFESIIVSQRLKNMRMMRNMEQTPVKLRTLRKGQWSYVQSDQLIPLDVVFLSNVPCDMVVIEGSAMTNEAVLTGESLPQSKDSIALRDDEELLRVKREDKRHVLFGGTSLLTTTRTAEEAANSPFPKMANPTSGCVCSILRTGFETSQGRLVRLILHSARRVSVESKEAWLFILFLLFFAIIASGYSFVTGLADPTRSRYKLILRCMIIIASVVPPELPIELSLAVNVSLAQLVRYGMFCTEPFRIPLAGAASVCCFDKTGTLTSDVVKLSGTIAPDGRLCQATNIPETIQFPLAGCHALVEVDGQLMGDGMEKAALTTIEWQHKGDRMVAPRGKKTMDIIHRHPFVSALKRMSTLVAIGDTYMALMKGAPEACRPLFVNVPCDYDDIYLRHMRTGQRVIALGSRRLPAGLTITQMRQMKRHEVEREMDFVGFVTFECPLKPETVECVGALHRAGHRVVMITGDNELTAAHIARVIGMVYKSPCFLRLDDEMRCVWVDIEGERVNVTDLQRYHLCVGGEEMVQVMQEHPTWLIEWAPRVRVFSRCAPEHKERIVLALKASGNVTLMCGDGTNDVGALKQSDVGVALLRTTYVPVEKLPPRAMSPAAALLTGRGRGRPPTLVGRGGGGPAQRGPALTAWEIAQAASGEDVEDDPRFAPIVQFGDASIAAPFTLRSKGISIMPLTDLIRLGRCTLVTTLQMYRILALNCLVTAYGLSVLHALGVRYAQKQMVASGIVIALCFLFMSRGRPLPTLAQERPHTKVFSVYVMGSILGQFAIHLWGLITVVSMVKNTPSYINKKIDVDADFEPSLMNTCVFIMSTMQQVSTFAVNYDGPPWTVSIFDYRPLLYALALLGAGSLFCGLEMNPTFNKYLELEPMPSDVFRYTFVFHLIFNALCGARKCGNSFHIRHGEWEK